MKQARHNSKLMIANQLIENFKTILQKDNQYGILSDELQKDYIDLIEGINKTIKTERERLENNFKISYE